MHTSTYVWVKPSGKELSIITRMVDEKMIIPVIDKVFSLEDIRNAYKYFENERNSGKIVFKIV
jgi:alcohol dehydrogenase